MTHMGRLQIWLIIGAFFLITDSAKANDAPVWLIGGGASPMSGHSTIRMDSEEVTIRLHKESYTVDAIFHFFNTGETTTEWVGFPKRGMGSSATFTGTQDFMQFQTWVGDQPVVFREEREFWSRVPVFLRGIFSYIVEDRRWLVKEVKFSGHTATTTRVKYEAPYHESDGRCAFYVYGTGSYWKGAIGKAIFTIDGTEVIEAQHIMVTCMPELAITRKQISKNVVSYALTNLEPPSDAVLRICFDPIFINRPPTKMENGG